MKLDHEPQIERTRQALEGLAAVAASEAAAACMPVFGQTRAPDGGTLETAHSAAEAVLWRQVLSPEWLAGVFPDAALSSSDRARLELALRSCSPLPPLPPPQDASEITFLRLAAAAAVGAVAGMLLLTPAAKWLLGMRDTGLLVGGPLGAALLVLATQRVSGSRRLRAWLAGMVGLAAAAELWLALARPRPLRWLWRRLGGRRTGFTRFAVYAAILLVLLLARRTPRLDRPGYEQTLKAFFRAWLDGVVATAIALQDSLTGAETPQNATGLLTETVARLHEARSTPDGHLREALEAILQQLRNEGFTAESAEGLATWDEAMRRQYDTFGHVEPGDRIVVEREPVRFRETVERKGLVRKLREGRPA